MSNSVVDQALEILVAGQDFTALRRALFATVAGHYLESESLAAPQSDQENYRVFALNALLARLPTRSLASVATITKGKTGIKDAVPGPFPLVVTAEARGSSDHFDFEGPGVMVPMVSSTGHGDASLKRVHFQDGQYAVGSILAVVQPKDTQQLSARYLHAYLSTFKDELLVSRMVGTANVSLTVAKIGDVPVPLLPISAQRKVDELMALCDRLEAQQADAESAHAQLVQALLDSLTQASDATEFAANWQRLGEHFHTLFTTEPSIDALKQTLLQLAVIGKLVPQNPSDEPASELLKRITEEKARLVAEGKLKKQKPLSDIEVDEALFELPSSWAWARFGNICAIKGELVRPEDFPSLRQVAPDCIEKGTGRLTDNRTVKDSGVKGPNSRFFAGQIVYSKIRPSLSKAVLVDFDGLCSADMYPIDAFISSEFLLKEILSEVFLEQVRVAENRIKMPKLNQESLTSFVLPVPPLAEQHRIVAKVDQLMTLCDQLKTRLTQARQLNEQLASTLVEQAVA